MLQQILDWSEVWAPVIPLAILILPKRNIKIAKMDSYIIAYLTIAILLSTMADVDWKFRSHLPASWIQSNNVFYNIHSILRSIFFGLVFIGAASKKEKFINCFLLLVYVVFAVIDFVFIENILVFSSFIFTTEGLMLLLMSLQCIWRIFTEEGKVDYKHLSIFWIAIGVCIYEAASFFILLFYSSFLNSTSYFANHIWDIHNIFYILFCSLLVKAFIGTNGHHGRSVN